MITTTTEPSQDLERLEVLRAYKKHMCRGAVNVTPFTEDRVVRYDTDVEPRDVPDIHREVRKLLAETVQGIHQGLPSQVVILAGNPGMGKSHLINFFRSRKRADELGYVLVCNSNHWRVDEFEECLLDWTLAALTWPSPNEPHLLLRRVEDLAFQALRQILSQPGQIARFTRKDASGRLRRLLSRLTGQGHGRFSQMTQQRDAGVFRLLDFPTFAGYVCDRFLHESSNPFHRYVLHVLLRYLFPEDRELVLHWLRRNEVRKEFLRKLGAVDRIDRHYKILDTIKILISLFTPEVSRNLSESNGTAAGTWSSFSRSTRWRGGRNCSRRKRTGSSSSPRSASCTTACRTCSSSSR